MKIIGITGGIGSGKSAVLNILKDIEGVYTIEADKLAHSMFQPGEEVYKLVVQAFGSEILAEDGNIDRKILGSMVMQDEGNLKLLNSIVHPRVKDYIRNDIEDKSNKYDYYAIEAALLIQDGYREICDQIWYVRADRAVRIERLIKYRGFTEDRAVQYMNNQPEEEYYINNCDLVIDNSGNVEDLKIIIYSDLNLI